MKNIPLSLAVLVSTSIVVFAQESGDIPGTPLGYIENQDEMFGYSRFWTYYDPYHSNYIGSRQWWEGNSLSGDWWGVRNFLDDSGIEDHALDHPFRIQVAHRNAFAERAVAQRRAGHANRDRAACQ